MPGSVTSCVPTTVLPPSLCASYQTGIRWQVLLGDAYPDGNVQQSLQADVPRMSWIISKRLTPAQHAALQSFYSARLGTAHPFYWYPRSADYDASGVNTQGRFTVRFNSPLRSTYSMGYYRVSFELIEVK